MELKEGSYSMNLFSGCNGIFVSSGCEPGKKEVELLITICGGRVNDDNDDDDYDNYNGLSLFSVFSFIVYVC